MNHLYFAYGSNLCVEDWQKYCRQHDMAAGRLDPVSPGWLPDHRLWFSHHSRARGGGALNVLPAVGSAVRGVLMRADAAAWQTLHHKEGHPNRYQASVRTVLDQTGTPVQAMVYILRPEYDRGFVRPTDDYVAVVRRGRVRHGLATDDLDAAVDGDVTASSVPRVFVYGTLKRGQCRQTVGSQWIERRVRPAEVAGRLVDLGHYPGLLSPTQPDQRVHGEVVVARDVEPLLRTYDQVECFGGYDSAALYIRILCRMQTEAGDRTAWTYRYHQPIGNGDQTGAVRVIPGGVWPVEEGVANGTRTHDPRNHNPML